MGMFDDLIPSSSPGAPPASPPASGGGMFDDLIPPPAPVTPGGLAKSFGVGVPLGALGLLSSGFTHASPVSMPFEMVNDVRRLMGGSPSPDDAVNKFNPAAGIDRTTDAASSAIQGLHPPQNFAEKVAQTSGEFLPGLIGGGEADIPMVARAVTRVLAPALGSELAGSAAQGTAFEPAAKLLGAAAAGAPGMIRGGGARSLPTADELTASGSAKFDQARNLGVEIKPQSVQDFATRVKSDLDNRLGVDENLAPKTHGILDKVAAGPSADGNAVATIDNLQSLRRKLGNAAGSPDPTERMAAASAKGALDDYLANLPSSDVIAGNPQAASALLQSANADYAAGMRSNAINAKVVRAELRASASNSGQNVANTIRQRMADILINPSLQRGYSPQELGQIERIVRGTVTGNTARFAKNIFGGGGGLGTLATLATGTAAAGPAGMALAAPGLAGRLISDASTMRQVRQLDQMIRSRSPLAQQQAPTLPADQLATLRRLLLSNAAPVGLAATSAPRQ